MNAPGFGNPILVDPHQVRALALGLADWPDEPGSPEFDLVPEHAREALHLDLDPLTERMTREIRSVHPKQYQTRHHVDPLLPDDVPIGSDGWPTMAYSESGRLVDLTQPVYGPDPPPRQSMPVSPRTTLQREVDSYQWGRETYHEFLARIQRIDASIEHPLAVNEMREYVMRMCIAYSGHPDPRIAVRALDMLARMKPVGLYDEKRARSPDALDATSLAAEIKTLLKQLR